MWWNLVLPVLVAVLGLAGLPEGMDRRVAEPQPQNSPVDLVQVQLLVPGKVKIGKTFSVLDEVENQGTGLALPTTTYFYLSKDDVLDDSDVLVGGRRVPRLGTDQSHSTNTPVTLKPDITPGTYYFIALADGKKELEERYRENNTRAVKIAVLAADPPKK